MAKDTDQIDPDEPVGYDGFGAPLYAPTFQPEHSILDSFSPGDPEPFKTNVSASFEIEIDITTSSGEKLLLLLFGSDPRPPLHAHQIPAKGQE